MKNLFIGLIIGIVLCAVAGFIILPGIKQTSYESGFAAGNTKGIATGTTAGIAQGIADLKAEQQRQQESIIAAQKAQEAKKKSAHKPRRAAKPVQNWHVIDGKIADPVADYVPAKEDKPTPPSE